MFQTFLAVYKPRDESPYDTYIDINTVKDLHSYTINNDEVILGANMSLNKTINVLQMVANINSDKFDYLKQVAKHLKMVANYPIRNVCENAAIGMILRTIRICGLNNLFTMRR